jgi:cytoskeleton protein RodZ
MGVSTREVADALNLPVHVIEALETDDFERLRPTVFTRGYLRSYARLLELSPESLLARYPEVTEETEAITGELPAVETPAGTPIRSLGIAAVVGIVVIVLLVWLLGDDESSAPSIGPTEMAAEVEEGSQPAADEAAEEVVEEAAEEAAGDTLARDRDAARERLGGASVQQPVDAATEDPSPSVADTQPSGPTPIGELPVAAESSAPEQKTGPLEAVETLDSGAGEPATADAAQPVAPVTPSFRERRITAFGDEQITFVFSEDCWVEVKALDGENLYSDLNRTGRTLVLTGRAPFRILLGYAPGVSLTFNGEPVALARYSRNNVANLVLGE